MSIFHDFAFVIAEREIVWRLIIEVGIEIRDAVGPEGMIDHAQPLKEVLRVAVSNQSSEDLPDIPVTWNCILAAGDVVVVALPDIVAPDEVVRDLLDWFTVENVGIVVNAIHVRAQGVHGGPPAVVRLPPDELDHAAGEEQCVVNQGMAFLHINKTNCHQTQRGRKHRQ